MSKSFKGKKFNIALTATPIKKLPFVIMYIKIKTSEKDLLFSLTKQYKCERLATVGVNPINGAVSMIAGVNGLVVECPENKIVQNITQYINYLGKAEVKPAFYLGEKKGSYKKLVEDMHDIELNIVGKCKTFVKNNIEKESVKIPKVLSALDTIQVKDRSDVEHKCVKACCCGCLCEKCIEVSDAGKIDVVMYLGNCDFKAKVEKNAICVSGCCCFNKKFCAPSKVISSKLKIYRTISKELKELNKFVNIFTDVRGLNLKFSEKDFAFDSEVVKAISKSCEKCEKCEKCMKGGDLTEPSEQPTQEQPTEQPTETPVSEQPTQEQPTPEPEDVMEGGAKKAKKAKKAKSKGKK